MGASSITRRLVVCANLRSWAWWQLPGAIRAYVAAVPLATSVLLGFAASRATWHPEDAAKYLLLLACGLVSVAATPRIAYVSGMTRDFITVWMLPVAILLPAVYVMLTPIPLLALTHWRISRGVVHRRVFSAGAMALGYGGASLVFHAIPSSFAGGAIGTGRHAFTWVVAVALAELVGGRGHSLLIVGAIKLSDPSIQLTELVFNREALQADFAESDLGIVITAIVGVNVVLAVFAVPTVLLIRRFMMHAQLLAQSRLDTKTGLLNASAWEAEAIAEVTRAVRTHLPLSVALIDIDHFKAVNDTYGHLVGDKVLRAVTDAIQEDLRSYDRAGRFGGEEFVVLLPQARQSDAVNIAERLRARIAAMAIPVHEAVADERVAEEAGGKMAEDDESYVRLTISVGVSSLNDSTRELNDLMAAADAALYYAKQNGRNMTYAAETAGPESIEFFPGAPTLNGAIRAVAPAARADQAVTGRPAR